MNVKRTSLKNAKWIQLAQDMHQGPAFVNTVMNLRILHDTIASNWVADQISGFRGRLRLS
jgi:hypothetical protein